jgi:hypothetical protein
MNQRPKLALSLDRGEGRGRFGKRLASVTGELNEDELRGKCERGDLDGVLVECGRIERIDPLKRLGERLAHRKAREVFIEDARRAKRIYYPVDRGLSGKAREATDIERRLSCGSFAAHCGGEAGERRAAADGGATDTRSTRA